VTANGGPGFDAVILAGGLARRMEGADKAGLEVGGTPMVVVVARAAAAAGARRIVVVGPERPGRVQAGLAEAGRGLTGGLLRVSEEPPQGGPVPGLRRGLAEAAASWVAVLAADLPFLTEAHLVRLLSAGLASGAAGAVLTDAAGRQQWLTGMWQLAALRAALLTYEGSSLRGLLGPLGPVLLRPARPAAGPGGQDDGAAAPWLDCDTPADLAVARRLAAGGPAAGSRRPDVTAAASRVAADGPAPARWQEKS
jgi:molybdenum cofactor guanylyltransferase